ncbi:hypothetical protein ACH5RR_018965 [Cinchona calisaya]|uniref:Uncharacterized protein n=1 Tax=Cinchona calisaya TaxID=153742 RepID=A0ABD2ZN31_9GENT
MRCFAARYHTCTYYFIKKLFNNVERSGVVVKGLRFSYTSFEFGSFTTDLPELLRILEVGIVREFDVKGCSFFQDLAKNFPNLKDLSVVQCSFVKRINISINSLKSIVLRVDRQVEVEINAPNMVSFEYSGEKIPCFKNLLGSTTTTMSFSGDQQCKYNIEIFGLSLATSNADRFMQLKEMLKKFLVPHKSKMSLSIHFESHVLSNESILTTIPINIAEETGVELEDLTFHMLGFQSSPLSLSSYSTILDILFMICRPKSICLRVEAFWDREFAKFFCERLLMDRRSSGKCSTSWENNFWENELKEVKIVKTVTVDEVEDKKQYFRIQKIFFSLKWKSCFDILNQI